MLLPDYGQRSDIMIVRGVVWCSASQMMLKHYNELFLFCLSIVAPTVRISPPQGILREGDSLSLTCFVTGNPLWVCIHVCGFVCGCVFFCAKLKVELFLRKNKSSFPNTPTPPPPPPNPDELKSKSSDLGQLPLDVPNIWFICFLFFSLYGLYEFKRLWE